MSILDNKVINKCTKPTNFSEHIFKYNSKKKTTSTHRSLFKQVGASNLMRQPV